MPRSQDKSNVTRWRGAAGDLRCRGNTWFIPEMCLEFHGTDRVRTVADPFLGLGSTAVACAQLGLNFVGVEMDKGYLEETVERVKVTGAVLSNRRTAN
jgi:site-specific DNA-methyltransferase (adenine-specific)